MTLTLPKNTGSTKGVISNIYNQIKYMKKRYYVYAHYNSKGELFYVGKGCNGRDEDLNQRSKEWLAEAKDGFTIVRIAEDLNMKHSFLIEQSIIKALKPNGLVNKKVSSESVKPYWRQTKPKKHVSTVSSYEDAIKAIEYQIDNNQLTPNEEILVQQKRSELDDENKKLRSYALIKLNKLKELNNRLQRAKDLVA